MIDYWAATHVVVIMLILIRLVLIRAFSSRLPWKTIFSIWILPYFFPCVNTLRPKRNGRHFPDDFFKCFSWMKMYKFRLRFHWILFWRVRLTIFQHWLRLRLGADKAASYYLNLWWLVYWRIYASLGLNELTQYYTQYFGTSFAFYWNMYTAP